MEVADMRTVGLVLFLAVCVLLILFDLLMLLSMIRFSKRKDRKDRKRTRKDLRVEAQKTVE